MDLQTPTFSTPITVIDLVHLKLFRMRGIGGRAVDYIVRRIKAPNCTQFWLDFDGEGVGDYDPSLLLDSALTSFEPILQNLVHKMPNPSLSIDASSIYWGQHPTQNSKSKLNSYFLLYIKEVPFLAITRWVERVVDPISSDRSAGQEPLVGALHITNTTLLAMADPEIAPRLKCLKSITQISVAVSTRDISQLLQILGEAGLEPSFPYLQQLDLHGYRWEARQLLEMVRARLSRPSPLVPHLAIVIQKETYPDLVDPGDRVVFDPDILRAIRALGGVSLEFAGGEEDWEYRTRALREAILF
ncbi:hypothetical protein FRC01_011927, partial [Tulasnella sp. 417]